MAQPAQHFQDDATRAADEDREQLAIQQGWAALTDEYHFQIRQAAGCVTQKRIAMDLGVDLSTVSGWLSCATGRGFPPPRLLAYLRKHVPALMQWEADHAGYLMPVKKEAAISADEALDEIERDALPEMGKHEAALVRSILLRRRRDRGAR